MQLSFFGPLMWWALLTMCMKLKEFPFPSVLSCKLRIHFCQLENSAAWPLTGFCRVFTGMVHSPTETLSDSWTRLKQCDWLSSSSCLFGEPDVDFTKSVSIHTLIENIITFISGDVGSSPGFREPEESMSTDPQAYLVAMEQQQQRAEVCVICCGSLSS